MQDGADAGIPTALPKFRTKGAGHKKEGKKEIILLNSSSD